MRKVVSSLSRGEAAGVLVDALLAVRQGRVTRRASVRGRTSCGLFTCWLSFFPIGCSFALLPFFGVSPLCSGPWQGSSKAGISHTSRGQYGCGRGNACGHRVLLPLPSEVQLCWSIRALLFLRQIVFPVWTVAHLGLVGGWRTAGC